MTLIKFKFQLFPLFSENNKIPQASEIDESVSACLA